MTRSTIERDSHAKTTARILIADDEERILDEYAYILRNSSALREEPEALRDLEAELFGEKEPANGDAPTFEVVMCRQGQDAIDAVDSAVKDNKPFSVAFLDVRMPPGIDGVVAAERIRELDPLINIVFVTGYSDVEPEMLGDRIPPPDKMIYCQKPLQSAELKQFALALSAKWSAEKHVQAMQARLHQLLSSTPVVIYSCNPTGHYGATFVSANVRDVFGYEAEDFLSDERFWIDRVHPDDLPHLRAHLQDLSQVGEISSEYRFRHADGEYRWVSDQARLVHKGGGDSEELVGCLVDVTARRQSEEKIRYLAYFDPLTGLPNRSFMREVIDHAVANAARYKRCLAVLFLDIDHFKRINDTLGHDAGDTLLRVVAQRLQSCVRDADQVCRQVKELFPQSPTSEAVSRLGGDEFVVVLTEIPDTHAATAAAQRIAESLAIPVQLAYDDVTVTASIGISVFPHDGEDAESILKHADAAMYSAKEQGRNRYQFFTKELNERAERRFSIENKLRKALERNEFILHYQPKIDIQRNRVVGMEALLRWQQPEVGLVSPVEFIPIAEELGMIVPIGEWVLHEASRQTAAWHAAGLPQFAVSVNLSAVQFKQRRLAQTIRGTLEASGLDPAFLELELTESMLIEDTEASATILKQLKDLGLNLSIDDFGTGYSSLSYLKRFPLNALKIDRSFIRDITSDKNDAAIVSATIGLAHNLNLRVVAEGVEQEAQAEILRSQGCDEAQGYLYSRPLSVEDFASWIRNSDAFKARATEAKPDAA